jgi:hypothetical protein
MIESRAAEKEDKAFSEMAPEFEMLTCIEEKRTEWARRTH